MLRYADYKFYADEYNGELSANDFDKYIVKASAYVRRITFGRADQAEGDEVKHATCAICDIFAQSEAQRDKHQGKGVVSENIDGYAVTYAQEQAEGETTEQFLNRKAYAAAELYLSTTDLLSWEV